MAASESDLKFLLAKKGQARPSGLPDNTARADSSPFEDLALTERPQDEPCESISADEQIKVPGEFDLFAETGKTGKSTNGHSVTGQSKSGQSTSDQSETAESETAESETAFGGSLLQVDFRRWRLSEGALEASEFAPLAETSELVLESSLDKDAAVDIAVVPQKATPKPERAEQPAILPPDSTPRRTPLSPAAQPRRAPGPPAAQPRRSWSKAGWLAAAAALFAGWLWMTGSDTPDPVGADDKKIAAAPSATAPPADVQTAAVDSSAPRSDETSTTAPPTETLVGGGVPATAAGDSDAAAPVQDPGSQAVDGEILAEVPAKGPSEPTVDIAAATAAIVAEPQPTNVVEPQLTNETAVQTPAFDIVRIEANGDALIAGTASPGSELIVLDNGNPIGRVKADAIGAWMLIPDKSMAQGDHEFSLVLSAPQGTVKVRFEETITRPASPTESRANDKSSAVMPVSPGRKPQAPRSGIPDDLARKIKPKPQVVPKLAEADISPPIPVRNPVQSETAGGPDPAEAEIAAFVIQLSSAPNAVGAAQEWAKLQRRFPDTLRNMELKLHKVSDANQGTVYRVRTGPFAQRADAQAYCSRFKAQQQDCLVVER